MKPTSMFAADPGLASGWATWDGETIRSGTDADLDLSDRLEQWLKRRAGRCHTMVVYESYTITTATAQKSQQHWSLELIGTARWLCRRYDTPFEIQKPAEAKRFCPDQRLRDLGIYAPGGPDHERDALRHITLAMARHGVITLRPLGK
jgi:hypothetical protein